ncbi:uroporphyrinogen-III synthase [Sulfuricurvum sp.]|uniref:uroporphyrinogen-III synthase n=1 Tax=Sulfuricurvum sp. TaxID=2025608 RepID=UPI0019866E4B|nr:uroporphyrinogen-III synthase [Sulfuricurvum sp.]MBD3798976.1 uroporphyrinogen-III synthase [Campylobacterota bacterium]MBD3805818.1 uroporphyrinogen-III synthase [Sulfuricurvum sp.]
MRPIYLISKTPYEGVIHIPILTISFFKPDIDFTRYDGIILTSKHSLIALERYDIQWEKLQCICVSEGTADAARQAGVLNLHIGDGYGRSIPELMGRKNLKGRWLYVRPKVIASNWMKMVNPQIIIDEAILYETTCNEKSAEIKIDDAGVLIFTSPSSIECFLKYYTLLPTHSVVTIGKTTRDAFKEVNEVSISPKPSIASAVECARKIAESTSTF